jgi:hypothetical protein
VSGECGEHEQVKGQESVDHFRCSVDCCDVGFFLVIPAKAGIQFLSKSIARSWIPAFAGMTN